MDFQSVDKAKEFFGENEAKKFLLLPSRNPRKKLLYYKIYLMEMILK